MNNFPVVDAITGNPARGNIISVATGTQSRLWDKLQVLFDVTVDTSGNVTRANRPVFQDMLSRLRNERILDSANAYSDFISRTRLFVPDHSVNPLKAMVRTVISDPNMQRRMIDAITSGI